MAKYRHLNSEDRSHIETGLNNRQSFKEIGEKVGKDCSTISKEIRSHMVFRKTGAYGRPFRISRSFFADSSYMLSFSVLCSCVCSRLISPSVSSWHKQDNTLMHQSPGHIQRRTPYNF